jgi:uncharacterized protein YbdZ (MbtH family)
MDTQETPTFQVVASASHHYSIWPGDLEPPQGWKPLGKYSLLEAEKRLPIESANGPSPRTFSECARKIVELLQLPAGWNSHSALPIAPQNASHAIELLAEFLGPRTPTPLIVPRVQGGIQLEWHTAATDIEVYIDSPGKVSFYAEQAGTDDMVEELLSGNEGVLQAWINRISGK